METKIKSYGDEVTDFPKVGSNHTCLAVISLDSALNILNITYKYFLKGVNTLKKWLLDKLLMT